MACSKLSQYRLNPNEKQYYPNSLEENIFDQQLNQQSIDSFSSTQNVSQTSFSPFPLEYSSLQPDLQSLQISQIMKTAKTLSLDKLVSYQELNVQEVFNSIEQVSLPPVEQQSRKRSSPPPGFEQIPNLTQPQPTYYNQKRVIYIRGFDYQFLTLQNISNLLRNFGHVVRMIFLRQKGALLAEFLAPFDAQRCKTLCEGINFCGTILKVFWSNYSTLEYQNSEKLEFWEESKEFKTEKLPNINFPSNTIHIGNLGKQACNEAFIRSYFSSIGKIQKIKLQLEQPIKNICYVEFTSLQESIQAVAFCHNTEIFGRKISVSFTKSVI